MIGIVSHLSGLQLNRALYTSIGLDTFGNASDTLAGACTHIENQRVNLHLIIDGCGWVE